MTVAEEYGFYQDYFKKNWKKTQLLGASVANYVN